MKGIKEYISYIRTRQEYLKKFVGEDYPLTEIRFYRELEAAIKEWGRNHKLVYKYLLGEVTIKEATMIMGVSETTFHRLKKHQEKNLIEFITKKEEELEKKYKFVPLTDEMEV